VRLLAIALAVTLALAAAAATPARGDEYNYQNLLVGTRSSGMGGADVAFADSVTGAYYNPAGITLAEARLVSVSLSAYRVDLSGFADIQASEGKAGRAAGFQFNSFPLNFGLITQLGNAAGLQAHTLAFNFFVEDNDTGGARVDVRIPGIADLYLRVRRQDRETVRFGPTWAARRGRLSIGASLFYRLRVEGLLVDSLVDVQDSVTYRLLDTQALHGSLVGQLGALWLPWRGLRVGVTVMPPGLTLHATSVGTALELRSGTQPQFVPSSEQPMTYKTPWKLALGVGWKWRGGTRVGADVTVHTAIGRYQVIPGLVEAQGETTVNWNLGVEAPVTQRLALRAGAFTNFAATPEPPMQDPAGFDDPGRLPHIDYYGATLGASLLTGKSSLDVSVIYQYGTGRAPAEASRGWDPVEGNIIVMMLGGTYAFAEGK